MIEMCAFLMALTVGLSNSTAKTELETWLFQDAAGACATVLVSGGAGAVPVWDMGATGAGVGAGGKCWLTGRVPR